MLSFPSAAQLLDHTRAMAVDIPRGSRVALVILPEQERPARFAEKAARSQGVFLTYFLDPDKAAQWLKQDTPKRRHLAGQGETKP